MRRLVGIASCLATMLLLVVGCGLLASSASAPPTRTATGSYGWPLKPFDVEHPVRSYFDEPRIMRSARSFHFGIDISAPDRTRVYAVEAGKAIVGGESVAVIMDRGQRAFGYWHIVPAVRDGSTVRKHQLIGRIGHGWGHVHFAEWSQGRHRNPLRPGALTPWTDTSSPTIRSVIFVREQRQMSRLAVRGTVDVVVDAYDQPSPTVPLPWRNMPVSPALVRWRVLQGTRVVQAWQTPIDFRVSLVPSSRFGEVFAPCTRQNRTYRAGRYCYFLARNWKTRALPDGTYRLAVEVADVRGNTARVSVPFRVTNEIEVL